MSPPSPPVAELKKRRAWASEGTPPRSNELLSSGVLGVGG